MEDRLLAFLEARAGPGVELLSLERLPGGYSQETYGFRARHNGQDYSLILRRRADGGGPLNSDLALEASLLRALHRTGMPVARVYWVDETGEHFGEQAFVMERLPGESRPDPLFAPGNEAQLARVANAMPETLARIHQLPLAAIEGCGLKAPTDWEEYIHGRIALAEAAYMAVRVEGNPAVAEIFRWLRRNIPEPMPFALCHGDFQLSNIMFDDGGISGVIDWELAHIGDPREDVGWLRTMIGTLGYDFLGAVEGGFMERYWSAGGPAMSEESLNFFQVLSLTTMLQPSINMVGTVQYHHQLFAPYVMVIQARAGEALLAAMGVP